MSHLEDLWSKFPTSKPPVEQIIAASDAPRAHHRGRTISALAAVATVAAGAVVATTLSTGTTGGHQPATAIAYVAFQADLKPATSCDALLGSYRQRAQIHVTPYGWDGSLYVTDGGMSHNLGGYRTSQAMPPGAVFNGSADTLDQQRTTLSTSLGTMLLPQGNSATGTNVQETGVDEADSVKTNGSLVARISGNTVAVFDVTGSMVKPRGTVGLAYLDGGSIMMSGSTVIAIGVDSNPGATGTRVDTVSLSDPDHPAVVSSVVFGGGTVTAARQQGTTMRLVMATGLPNLAFRNPQAGVRTNDQALAYNRNLVNRSTLRDWLPTYDLGSGKQQLIPCGDVAVPPAGVPLGTTSIVSFDVAAATALSGVGIAGTLGTAYESQQNLYLTVGGITGGCYARVCPRYAIAQPCCFNQPQGPTTILQFSLDGVRTSHVATGQVQGIIKDRWSMDEYGGTLRVVTTRFGKLPKSNPYGTAPNVNVIETLAPHGATLVRLGELTGLGKNQSLDSARWFDDLAIISTSARTDPLYTIDLRDPRHPSQLGALHLPGTTQYIHPISTNRFITISTQQGPDGSSHAQVALFDTTDLRNVRQLVALSPGPNTWSLAANDPMNFTWLPRRGTALTSFSGDQGMVLGEYTAGRLTLIQKLVPLAGNQSDVRTFEVVGGKVVLVSGGTVTFLAL